MRFLALLLFPICSYGQVDFVLQEVEDLTIDCRPHNLYVEMGETRVYVESETLKLEFKVISTDAILDGEQCWLAVDNKGNKYHLRGFELHGVYGMKFEPEDPNLVKYTITKVNLCD